MTRRAPEQWWGSVSQSMEDPKGNVGPESGGLSRTVEKFSHNQTQTELHRPVKRTPVHQGAGGREGKGEDLIVITTHTKDMLGHISGKYDPINRTIFL